MRARHENTLTVCILSALSIFAALECGVVCGCAPSSSRPHKSPAPSPSPPPNSKPSLSASTATEPAPFKKSQSKANHTNSPQTPTPSSAAKTPRPPRSPTSSPSPVSYFLALPGLLLPRQSQYLQPSHRLCRRQRPRHHPRGNGMLLSTGCFRPPCL